MTDELPTFNPAAIDTRPKGDKPYEIEVTETFDPKVAAEKIRLEKQARLEPLEAPLGLIPATSFSSLSNFEKCPHHLYLSKVEKCPDVAGPAAQRGNEIHDKAERYIMGEFEELPTELGRFVDLFEQLRGEYSEGKVHVEEDWAFTRDWDPTGWTSKDCWLRVKLDAMYREDKTSAKVYDWKTGRKFGNEVKHGQQSLLYVLAAFVLFPELEHIEASMVYLDKGETMTTAYTRDTAMLFFDRYNLRLNTATTCIDFKPTPSAHACKWCPHAKTQEGRDMPACGWRYGV